MNAHGLVLNNEASIMWFITSVLSAVFFALASFIITVGARHNYYISQMLLGLYISGSVMFALYLTVTSNFQFNQQLLLWGVIIGIGSSFGNALFTYALKLGPVSLTAPIVNSNVILVIVMSVLYFGEIITITQTIAIVLLLTACFILPFDPDEKKGINNKSWYLVILFTIFFMFLLNGGLKITQELKLNNSVVLFFSYIFSTLVFLFSTKYLAIRDGTSLQKQAINTGLSAGIFSFLGLHLYALSLENGPASIVVPIFSSRNVLVAMMCLWFFKEKLSVFQKWALLSLLGGLFLVTV